MYCPNCGTSFTTTAETPPFDIEHEYETQENKPYSPLLVSQIQVRDMRAVDLRFFQDKKAAIKKYLTAPGAEWSVIKEAMREVMLAWDEFALLKYGPIGLECFPGKGTIVNIDPETGQVYDAPTWYERRLTQELRA